MLFHPFLQSAGNLEVQQLLVVLLGLALPHLVHLEVEENPESGDSGAEPPARRAGTPPAADGSFFSCRFPPVPAGSSPRVVRYALYHKPLPLAIRGFQQKSRCGRTDFSCSYSYMPLKAQRRQDGRGRHSRPGPHTPPAARRSGKPPSQRKTYFPPVPSKLSPLCFFSLRSGPGRPGACPLPSR